MIDWSTENITEPLLTSDISENELMNYCKHNNTPATELKNYACHTQVAERCVKLVSDAAVSVSGQKQPDEFFPYMNQFVSKHAELRNKNSILPLNEKQSFLLLFH